jgi:Protein of unknown function (DUF1761)
MPDLNILAVLVATLAVFVLGATYYAVFGARLAEVSDAAAAGERPPPRKLVVELLRGVILSVVVAGVASQGEIDEWAGGLLLGVALWIGFPVVLWIGAIIHENTPWRLAAIHAGDWLVKLLAVVVIVTVWQ